MPTERLTRGQHKPGWLMMEKWAGGIFEELKRNLILHHNFHSFAWGWFRNFFPKSMSFSKSEFLYHYKEKLLSVYLSRRCKTANQVMYSES